MRLSLLILVIWVSMYITDRSGSSETNHVILSVDDQARNGTGEVDTQKGKHKGNKKEELEDEGEGEDKNDSQGVIISVSVIVPVFLILSVICCVCCIVVCLVKIGCLTMIGKMIHKVLLSFRKKSKIISTSVTNVTTDSVVEEKYSEEKEEKKESQEFEVETQKGEVDVEVTYHPFSPPLQILSKEKVLVPPNVISSSPNDIPVVTLKPVNNVEAEEY